MRPFQGARQIVSRFRLVQPEFVFRHHERRADEPHPWLLLFHKNLPSSELFAERNLSIRADDLDAGLGSESFHIRALSLFRWYAARESECKVGALLLHERTIAPIYRSPQPKPSGFDFRRPTTYPKRVRKRARKSPFRSTSKHGSRYKSAVRPNLRLPCR